MAKFTEQDIRDSLSKIPDPIRDGDIITTARVQGLVIRDGNIGFTLEISPEEAEPMEATRLAAEQAVRDIPGVLSVTCVLTAHQNTPSQPAEPAQASPNKGKDPSREIPEVFQRIGKVIAVASGKGGVGKSTIALNLALACAKQGLRTGLLDADIYGPSLPALLNITQKPEVNEAKKLLPIESHGLQTMSIGYMVPPEQAMIWRGPMVQSALIQLLNDVEWPDLDIMILDMPPGTGDIQLTMAQRIPVDGAIVVSTPHALALADVKRAVAMFQRVNLPVIGVIENMAYMQSPSGEKLFPFGEGGSQALAEEMDTPFLGAIALDPAIQQSIRDGKTLFDMDSNSTPTAAQTSEAVDQFTQMAKTLSA
jgi:ATP-binding protein involved in chromosome partitioning